MSAVPAVWLSASCDLCGWQELKAAPAPADATAPMCAHTCPVNAAHVLAPAAVALPPTPSGPATDGCGERVEIVGLKARPSLNGRSGCATKWQRFSGRLELELEADGAQVAARVAVRPGHVRRVRGCTTPRCPLQHVHDRCGPAGVAAGLGTERPRRGEAAERIESAGSELAMAVHPGPGCGQPAGGAIVLRPSPGGSMWSTHKASLKTDLTTGIDPADTAGGGHNKQKNIHAWAGRGSGSVLHIGVTDAAGATVRHYDVYGCLIDAAVDPGWRHSLSFPLNGTLSTATLAAAAVAAPAAPATPASTATAAAAAAAAAAVPPRSLSSLRLLGCGRRDAADGGGRAGGDGVDAAGTVFEWDRALDDHHRKFSAANAAGDYSATGNNCFSYVAQMAGEIGLGGRRSWTKKQLCDAGISAAVEAAERHASLLKLLVDEGQHRHIRSFFECQLAPTHKDGHATGTRKAQTFRVADCPVCADYTGWQAVWAEVARRPRGHILPVTRPFGVDLGGWSDDEGDGDGDGSGGWQYD